MASSKEAIRFPCRNSREEFGILVEDLPQESILISNALKGEYAPLKSWLQCAVAYYRLGQFDQFTALLKTIPDEVLMTLESYKTEKEDRVALVNLLAAYYALLSTKATSKADREAYHSQSTQLINSAQRIMSRGGGQTVLNFCLSQFRSGRDDVLPQLVDFIANAGASDDVVPAHMAKLLVLYHRGEFRQALDAARKIFSLHPNPPASYRLPLAYIHFKLGNLDLSRRAFLRVLQLDPENVEALLGLAVHELNASPAPRIDEALAYIKRAYELNSHHPCVLLHLADLFFIGGEAERAKPHALRALDYSDDPALRSIAFRLLGTIAHAENEYAAAAQYYSDSIKAQPHAKNPLAHMGLGQLHVRKGEFPEALRCFEEVISSPVHAGSPEPHMYLARIRLWQNDGAGARPHLKRVLDVQPNPTASLLYAQLVQREEPAEALRAYRRAADAIRAQGETVPQELANNIGVLSFEAKDYAAARLAFCDALDLKVPVNVADDDDDGNASPVDLAALVTDDHVQTDTPTVYNLARTCEAEGNYDTADSLYSRILTAHPSYSEAHARRACILQARGKLDEASNMFREIIERDPRNLDAACMWADHYLSRNRPLLAQRVFEEAAKQISPDDPYMMVSLGNIQQMKHDSRSLERAQEYYLRVLSKNLHNVYAANGLGVIMAEMGYMSQASDIFLQVRDAKPDFPCPWINLGHVHYSQRQFPSAIQMYRHCFEKIYDSKNPELLRFIANVQFEQKNFQGAADSLTQALQLKPVPYGHFKYNLAFAKGEHGRHLVNNERRTRADIDQARELLREAMAIMQELTEFEEHGRMFSRSSAAKKIGRFQDSLQQIDEGLSQIERREQEETELLEKQLQLQAEREEAEREKLAAQEKEQLEKLEQIRQGQEEHERNLQAAGAPMPARQKGRSKAAVVEESSDEEAPEAPAKRRGRKNQRKQKVADSSEDEGEEAAETEKKPKRKPARRQNKRTKKEESDSSEVEDMFKRQRTSLLSDDEEEKEQEEGEPEEKEDPDAAS